MNSWHKKKAKLLAAIKKKSTRAALLAESNYGRDFGWYIELNGKIIAELIKCRFEDMFWYSYEIIPKNSIHKKTLFDSEKILHGDFKFKNKKLNEYAESAFLAGTQNLLPTKKRIIVRALYLTHNNIIEEKALKKFNDFMQIFPEEEKQISSNKFEFIRLSKAFLKKEMDFYFIEIYSNGNVRCIEDTQAPNINKYEYNLNENTIQEIQKLVVEYKLFNLKPSKINTSRTFNWFLSKIYKSNTYNIGITNEVFEKFLEFRISLFTPLESQKKLITFFNQIETLVIAELPESL